MLNNIVSKKIRRALFRYYLYGSTMIAGEVLFYTITKIGRKLPDWINWFFEYGWRVDEKLELNHIWEIPISTLYGQASLWMFFVYASICLFGLEPTFLRIRHWQWYVRGTIYMLIILTMECSLGWVLFYLTGYEIWYYSDRLAVFRYTSLAIAPMWFVIGLLSENIMRLVDALSRAKIKLKSSS